MLIRPLLQVLIAYLSLLQVRIAYLSLLQVHVAYLSLLQVHVAYLSLLQVHVAYLSLLQVHVARLKSSGAGGGEQVVLKLQHEGVASLMQTDMVASLRIARAMRYLHPVSCSE